LNKQGMLTAWSNPRSTASLNNDVASSGWSAAFLQKLKNSKIYSLPDTKAVTTVYLPQDPISRQYCPSKVTEVYNSEASTKYLGGELGFLVTGAVAAQTFEVEIVLNFEGCPYLNTFSLTQASPSKSDPLSLAHATNVIADTVPVAPMKDAKAMKSMNDTALKVHNADTSSKQPHVMDMLLNGVSAVSDALPAITNIAKTVGPVLSTALSFL